LLGLALRVERSIAMREESEVEGQTVNAEVVVLAEGG
jgi:hypothetical protein